MGPWQPSRRTLKLHGERAHGERYQRGNHCQLNGHCSVVGKEEHRGQAPPQPIQPELDKVSRTTSVPGSWQRRERRRRDERLTTKSTTTTTTTHPKMRIDQNGGVFKDSATPDEDQTKRDSRRSTSICSTFLSVPQLSTLVTQIGRLLFASSQIEQATSNS